MHGNMTDEKLHLVGEANVLELFMITNGRQKIPVAGCRCVGGSLSKKERFKLVRDNEVLFDGNCQHFHFKVVVYNLIPRVYCVLCREQR